MARPDYGTTSALARASCRRPRSHARSSVSARRFTVALVGLVVLITGATARRDRRPRLARAARTVARHRRRRRWRRRRDSPPPTRSSFSARRSRSRGSVRSSWREGQLDPRDDADVERFVLAALQSNPAAHLGQLRRPAGSLHRRLARRRHGGVRQPFVPARPAHPVARALGDRGRPAGARPQLGGSPLPADPPPVLHGRGGARRSRVDRAVRVLSEAAGSASRAPCRCSTPMAGSSRCSRSTSRSTASPSSLDALQPSPRSRVFLATRDGTLLVGPGQPGAPQARTPEDDALVQAITPRIALDRESASEFDHAGERYLARAVPHRHRREALARPGRGPRAGLDGARRRAGAAPPGSRHRRPRRRPRRRYRRRPLDRPPARAAGRSGAADPPGRSRRDARPAEPRRDRRADAGDERHGARAARPQLRPRGARALRQPRPRRAVPARP